MESEIKQGHLPLIHAASVFLIMFSALLLVAIKYDFSTIPNPGSLLFLATAAICFLVAKITYTESQRSIFDTVQSNERDLELSAEVYTELFNNSPVPYIVIDESGEVKFFNRAAVRLLGHSADHLSHINVYEYLQTEQPDHLSYIVNKYQNGISANNELVAVQRKDGAEAWALLSLFSFVNNLGQRAGLMTLVDITRQKRAEDAKSEFVSLASHQLRTPIAGIKWSAELLEMDDTAGTLSKKQRQYVDRLIDSINRLAVLVDDFLRVSRFDLGTFTPEYEDVSLVKLFHEIVDDLTPRAEQKNVTVISRVNSATPNVYIDPNLIRMIVTNLMSNAVKYSRSGGSVQLETIVSNKTLEIVVTDTGIGIPKEDQKSIFSKLFRSSNAIREGVEGTGLGLYIVRSAVQVLKGQIHFTSKQDVGTTFTVTIPVTLT